MTTGETYAMTGRGTPRDDSCVFFFATDTCVLDFGFQSPGPVNPFPVAGKPIGARQTIRSPSEGVILEAEFFSVFIINGNGDLTAFHEKAENLECFVVPPPFPSPF